MRRRLVGPLTAVVTALAGPQAYAQAGAGQPHVLDEQVVVAHRTATVLRESIAATTVLDRFTLERLPVRTLAEALAYIPGLAFTDRDGAGELPMVIARGFFGGGETDYVLLTVDGVPINDLRSGLAEWSQIPLADIERIEVLRGGGSTAYGDAALGAVVNVVTRRAAITHRLISELRLGSWGDQALQTSIQNSKGANRFGVGLAAGRVQGFRSHAKATNVALSASFARQPPSGRSVYGRVSVQRLQNQEPGPLSAEQIVQDPRQFNSLFVSDERRRDLAELGTGIAGALGSGRLTADLRIRVADDEQVRTLPLTPDFGDTQFQDARAWDLWGRMQYHRSMGRSRVVAGLEAERGGYDSRYTDPIHRDVVRSQEDGKRTKVGLYAELQQQIGHRFRLAGGIRHDGLTLRGSRAERSPVHFSQWSPRLGLNFAYADGTFQAGNLYLVWTRSFKAPTAYQLYDARLIQTGEPDAAVNLSNPALRPQHSSAVEVGIYHRLTFGRGNAFAELSLSAYQLDVTDEIDFDLRTFKYGNILESRHSGIEGSLTTALAPSLELRNALTLMRVTFQSGSAAGNRLRNMPSTVLTSAVHGRVATGMEATVTHRYFGSLYLDDANRETLPGTHYIDAAVSGTVGSVRLRLTGVNLNNSHASRGGFLVDDPDTGESVRLLYPGGGRRLQVGVTVVR